MQIHGIHSLKEICMTQYQSLSHIVINTTKRPKTLD